MPSVYELALCCEAVYSTDPQVEGWLRINKYDFPNQGVFAALFEKDDEFVLAYRGTDDLKDVGSDAQLFGGAMPWQFSAARSCFVMSQPIVEGANLTLTGHSLGGGLASLISARVSPQPVVTFNAPGTFKAASGFLAIGYLIDKHGLRTYISTFKKALHIRSDDDLVSIGTGRKIIQNGKTLENDLCPKTKTYLHQPIRTVVKEVINRTKCAHRMVVMVQLVKAIPEYHEKLRWT